MFFVDCRRKVRKSFRDVCILVQIDSQEPDMSFGEQTSEKSFNSFPTAKISLISSIVYLKLSLDQCRKYKIHNIKLPKQHHDKRTVNVYVYQITKKDTQRHTTDKSYWEDGGYRNRMVSDKCKWVKAMYADRGLHIQYTVLVIIKWTNFPVRRFNCDSGKFIFCRYCIRFCDI